MVNIAIMTVTYELPSYPVMGMGIFVNIYIKVASHGT